MADTTASSTMIQPPTQSVPDQVRVFAMPARYRHGAVVNMVEPQKTSVVPVATVQPPVPPKVLPPIPPALTKPKQETHVKKGLLIAGGIVILAIGISGYLFWRSVQKTQEKQLPEPTPTETTQTTPVVTNEQTPAQTTEVPAETPPATNPFPSAVTPGVDTDSDGLSDVEENSVYGTNPNLPDTDSDGFLDGNEVFHGYNPNGTAPGTLVLAGLAQLLQIDGFQMLYPFKWTQVATPTANGSLISSSTGETITVTYVAKDVSLSLADWYQQSGKSGAPSASKTRKGYPMLVDKNQLGVSIDLGNKVVSLVYDTSTKATIDYLQTFQMMVNSVELVK